MRNARIVVVVGILLVPAWAAAAEDSPRPGAKTGYWPAEREQAVHNALSFAAEMIARVHDANLVAIRIGGMAEQHATAPALRRYGRLMAQDRRVQDRQLLDYARRAGVPVGPAQFLTEEERARSAEKLTKLEHLATLSGPAFDNELVGLATIENQSAITLVDQVRGEVADPDLRIMLDKVLPILKQHVTIARTLGQRTVGMTDAR